MLLKNKNMFGHVHNFFYICIVHAVVLFQSLLSVHPSNTTDYFIVENTLHWRHVLDT
jgi:hypothetical protein